MSFCLFRLQVITVYTHKEDEVEYAQEEPRKSRNAAHLNVSLVVAVFCRGQRRLLDVVLCGEYFYLIIINQSCALSFGNAQERELWV